MALGKRILAIETSGRHGSVATLRGESEGARLVVQVSLSGNQRTAQSLAPAMQQVLATAGWSPKDVEMVGIAVGPGSFTGLRIGVTTAKAFAYSVGAEVVGVNTLLAIASQATPSAIPLWTVMEAQRQELFAARHIVGEMLSIRSDRETSIISQERWIAELRLGERVTGPALKRLATRLPAGIEVVPEELWQPMATAVGQVAWQAYQSARRDDVWKLAPNYYRPSAAEEKRMT